jgi:hypothetical protein
MSAREKIGNELKKREPIFKGGCGKSGERGGSPKKITKRT